jgi:hypothetical protein
MRTAGLEGRRKKRWRTTTIPDPAAERTRDLIQRDFAPRPGTDGTYGHRRVWAQLARWGVRAALER